MQKGRQAGKILPFLDLPYVWVGVEKYVCLLTCVCSSVFWFFGEREVGLQSSLGVWFTNMCVYQAGRRDSKRGGVTARESWLVGWGIGRQVGRLFPSRLSHFFQRTTRRQWRRPGWSRQRENHPSIHHMPNCVYAHSSVMDQEFEI